jgi:hypothetical protein
MAEKEPRISLENKARSLMDWELAARAEAEPKPELVTHYGLGHRDKPSLYCFTVCV